MLHEQVRNFPGCLPMFVAYRSHALTGKRPHWRAGRRIVGDDGRFMRFA
ncbi:MAG: hypothetical protein JNK51_11420 [Blastocatellia bacterium]|nr:hypothetical protein [Chloracidobacterium sp.]MBL8185521.1 hypothetical protein [Blastocatellia bacterium]HRJ90380.1 hypothetical protein [Pyrinomonadaceae bacterium]HRK51896.1 hypothetical protein [Pyrinomonadaceae bacterium]